MSLSDHSAPGTAAAFSYQFERALLWLARSPAETVVGIETNDDVAVLHPEGNQTLEQDKHSIQQASKPYGDRSHDLWNTLSIWLTAVEEKEVCTEKTKFVLVTNKTLPECIATQIGRAKTQPEIDECVKALTKAAKNPPQGTENLMAIVLKNESIPNLKKLILACEVVDGSQAAAGPALRAQTVAHLPLPDWCSPHADSITNELLGWMHATVLETWQQGKPAWVKRNHFINQLDAILARRKRVMSRERSAHLIPVNEDTVGSQKGSRFVKQLHLITDDDNTVDGAIKDFIRCNIEKARLSREGNITDQDWLCFEDTLLTRWQKIRTRILRMNQGQPLEDLGFNIFTDTTEEHKEKLAGCETDQIYLTSGTYHRLAELLKVGWHPEFDTLMKQWEESP
jgi:hypothetical protein